MFEAHLCCGAPLHDFHVISIPHQSVRTVIDLCALESEVPLAWITLSVRLKVVMLVVVKRIFLGHHHAWGVLTRWYNRAISDTQFCFITSIKAMVLSVPLCRYDIQHSEGRMLMRTDLKAGATTTKLLRYRAKVMIAFLSDELLVDSVSHVD